MAYLAPTKINGAHPMLNLASPELRLQTATFTPLEWSVVRLSRADQLWSIIPTLFQRLVNVLLARKANRLANDRLEALRRMAVLSRHFGFGVPGEKVGEFLEAGFSVEQYELLVSSVLRSEGSPGMSAEALI